jgi:pyridinium-3,5-bisthiocarboxylic acid mononucleotide nickel chelatase
MSAVAYLDCTHGLAGDMLLGALLDAGAPSATLHAVPSALGLGHVRIDVEVLERGGVRATHVTVDPGADAVTRRSAAELRDVIEGSTLSPVVRDRSLLAVDAIAVAEGAVHGADPATVTLHELSGADTLVDVCGTFALLEALGVTDVTCSPLPFARGTVATQHGVIPTPGPAVLAILAGAPWVGVASSDELVTPTGAAIVATVARAFGELPPMTIDHVGTGAGTRDPAERPNVLRVLLGEPMPAQPRSTDPRSPDVIELEANLDDLNPELVPDAVERCFAAGALDVWTVPAQMKKGRPGVILTALVRPDLEHDVAAAILEHTSSLGVRSTPMRRRELERVTQEVQVRGYAVRVKLGLLQGRVVNVAPEHDDCASVASLTGLPVKRVWAEALAAASTEPVGGIDGPAG